MPGESPTFTSLEKGNISPADERRVVSSICFTMCVKHNSITKFQLGRNVEFAYGPTIIYPCSSVDEKRKNKNKKLEIRISF